MSEEREYNYQGNKVMGREVEFETEKDVWNVYKLTDGTRVKIKAILVSVAKLDEFDAVGNPVYLVNASPAVGIDVPSNLKKKPA